MRKSAHALLLLGTAALARPASAADKPLPADVQQMLREAYPKERATVANVVKRLYPDSSGEVDRFLRKVDEENKARAETAGFFESLQGEVSGGAYLSTGNTREWGVTAAASIKRQTRTWVHSLDLRADIKTENGSRTDERLFAGYAIRKNFDDSRWFAGGGLRFERDRFGGIDRRFGEYAGVGYQVANGDRFKLDIMAGPGLRQTRYVSIPSDKQFGIFARSTMLWKLSDTLRFNEDLTAAVAKGDDTYSSLTSLTTDIYGRFALRLSVAASVETEPPPDRRKVETYSRATLVYTFEP